MNTRKPLGGGRFSRATYGWHHFTKALQIVAHIGVLLVLPLLQKRLDTLVKNGLAEKIQPAELADELDISEHLLLGRLFGRLALLPVHDRVAR